MWSDGWQRKCICVPHRPSLRGSHEARHPHSTKLGVPTALTDSSIQSTPDNPSHRVLSPCTISECSLLDTSNAHPSPRAPTVLTSPSTQLAPKPYTKPIIRRVRRKHGRLRSNRCIESAPGRLSNTLEITQSARFRYSTKISQHLWLFKCAGSRDVDLLVKRCSGVRSRL